MMVAVGFIPRCRRPTARVAERRMNMDALLAAVRPDLNQAGARLLLCAGADDEVGGAIDTPGFDNYHGWGRLNAFNSLLLATTFVDRVRHISNRIELSWVSPANASNKQPYQVEYKTSLTNAWITLTNANAFRYETNRTYWIDDGSPTDEPGGTRFYRVGLRRFLKRRESSALGVFSPGQRAGFPFPALAFFASSTIFCSASRGISS